MSLPLIIVNPESASGSTRKTWPQIASDLRSHFGPFKVMFTERRGDAVRLASDAARQGVKLIVACGGDGTISEVANGILDSGKDAELGILPSGTGGDFRRTLQIPTQTRSAAAILSTGQTRRIDVGKVSFVDNDGVEASRYFLGVASCGISTRVIERVKKGSPDWLAENVPAWFGGKISFGAALLHSAVRTASSELIVQLDDSHERHLTVTNLCIANARYFGGGMKIAPQAKLNDGKLDVISVADLSAFKIFSSAPRLYTGSHLSMPEVSHALARKVSVRAAKRRSEIAIEVDGELPGRLPATFQVLPKALKVRTNADRK